MAQLCLLLPPLLAGAFVAACSLAPRPAGDPAPLTAGGGYLFRAEATIQDEWLHIPLRGETDYRLAVLEGRVAIRAVGRRSASVLIRPLRVDTALCAVLEWSWAVAQLQPGADLTDKTREDVAASLFLLFGDPGLLSDPEPVPTLRYVWTNEAAEPGAVIDNPYMAGVVRSLVVRAGPEPAARWVVERRDIRADFEAAFGHPPADEIHAIALFTDNDQTGEPVEAYYGWARVHCVDGAGPADPDELWD